MAQPQTEQRSARRFRLDLPVAVTFPTSDTPGIIARTRDVSSRGVFIYSDSGLQKGSALEFVMTLPPEITLAAPIRVRCQGTVVRVDKSANYCGVAVAIGRYDFLHKE